jgi:transcriptional regulator
MFVPGSYREPDGSWTAELVRNNPLATLISNGAETHAPYATHVPVIMDPKLADQSTADLSAMTLWGHLNRANPHWLALAPETPVAVIFTGPHGYVSPTVYNITPAAPTWNFTAVHVRGVLRRVEPDQAGDETLETVVATVRAFEGRFGAGWCMADSIDYFRRILPGVGAFRITVTDTDSMFKLSQEQRPTVRDRVQRSFAERESSHHRAVAAMMSRLPCAAGGA